MRQERTVQATIFEVFAGHQIGCELKAISGWLDGQRALVSLVAGDLRREGVRQTGRRGLPAETVLRCALLKQQRQLSYEELAFHLEDSASFRAFARLPLAWSPKKSVLHRTISAIRAETWEAINRALIAAARAGQGGSGRDGADRQHRYRGADARAERQRAVVGCRAPDDAAAAPGGGIAGSTGDALARPPAHGQALRHRDPVQSRQRPPAPALSQADCCRSCHPGGAAAGRRAAGRAYRHRGRALARPGEPLSAADRARARPDRTPGAARPSGAGQ